MKKEKEKVWTFFSVDFCNLRNIFVKWIVLLLFVLAVAASGSRGALFSLLPFFLLWLTVYLFTRPKIESSLDEEESREGDEMCVEEMQKEELEESSAGPIELPRNGDGRMLLEAVSKNDIERVTFLMDSGVDPNSTNSSAVSALMFAVKNDHLEMTRLLIERGAMVDSQSDGGLTALKIAKENKNSQIELVLKEYGAL